MRSAGNLRIAGKEEEMSSLKIGIIGVGHVGAHVLYTLALQGLGDDFVIADLEENLPKARAERQDVLDSTEFLSHPVRVEVGQIEDLGDRDIIVNAVGNIAMLKGTHTRLTEMEFNVRAVASYAERLKKSGFKGVLINISNPCDVITKWLNDLLELPKGHVFGTGTGLDTARLKIRLQQQTGIDAKSISAYMIGEHGNEQISAWSAVNFNGIPLSVKAQQDPRFRFDLNEMEKSAREGGWTTFNGKFCTEYAIALTAARLVDIVSNDKHSIVPVSCELDGQYGESGLFAGVPAVIGRNGVEEVIELSLTGEEKERFHQCCEGIRANIAESKKIFAAL